MESNFAMAAGAIILATILFFLTNRKRKAPPPAPPPPQAEGAWPLIGHLHLLGGAQPPHITLANMADKYGPIFTLKLGVHRSLVVSDSEIARECLTTHDKALANRPTALAMEILGYNYTLLGFTRYGPLWRALRKFTVKELLSHHRLHVVRAVRASEVEASIKDLREQCRASGSVVVEMKRWLGDMTLNVIFRVLIGRRFVAEEGWRPALRDFLELAGKFVVSDSLPYLRWMDIGGHEKAMKRTMKDLDDVLQVLLEEHRHERREGRQDQDFMDAVISAVDHQLHHQLSGYHADTLIKATCLALILASSDTTAVTMTWALSLLLNNPHSLEKAQQELDIQVGKHRQIQESDIKNLDYLEAILKETLRLFPAVPLLIPHESMEDCTVGGYHVPAGTCVMFNASKIQRDPRQWENPSEFNPERFLTTHKDVDVGGQNFELIPFGSGRRMCPGTNFAMEVMQFALAKLLHEFYVLNPYSEAVDMQEGSGSTNIKVTPLQVLLKPRLGAH